MATSTTSESALSLLISQLCQVLTGNNLLSNAFRIHTKNLASGGELSFQTNLNYASWKALKRIDGGGDNCKQVEDIFVYSSTINAKEVSVETLPAIIQGDDEFKVKIDRFVLNNGNCHVYLNRSIFIPTIIKGILNAEYCVYKLPNIIAKTNVENPKTLTQLRVQIFQKIIDNFSTHDTNPEEIWLTEKSSDNYPNRILCGCVTNDKGQKQENMQPSELYDEYAANMRMMFEHRYGVRKVINDPEWKIKINNLGHAAVTFQMIQNCPQKTISLPSKHHVIKDAAFVIYNGARIKSIIRRFYNEVEESIYPQLEDLNKIDFSLLKREEEWDLIYIFLAQYQIVLKNCVKDLHLGKLNLQKVYEFLVQFSTAFSIYYSRIKIMVEPRDHLVKVIHARIYLLHAIDTVLTNILLLLNIEPINNM